MLEFSGLQFPFIKSSFKFTEISLKDLHWNIDILSFIRDLGHSGDIIYLTDVNVDYLHQPWRAFSTFINKCLSGKETGMDKIRLTTTDTQVYGTILLKEFNKPKLLLESKAFQNIMLFASGEESSKPKRTFERKMIQDTFLKEEGLFKYLMGFQTHGLGATIEARLNLSYLTKVDSGDGVDTKSKVPGWSNNTKGHWYNEGAGVTLRKIIIAVTRLTIMKKYDYDYLEEIEVRRDDQKLYTFKEGDFKRLRLQDIEDMLLLLVQQSGFNVTSDERQAALSEEVDAEFRDVRWWKDIRERSQATGKDNMTLSYFVSTNFSQNRRNLPRDIPLDSVVVLRYEKRSKSENKGRVPTEMELVLEQTLQGTSYEFSISAKGVEELKRKVKIKGEKKEALLTLRQKSGQYICCRESQR
ncbi:hypothetical protein Tco_0340657 [Tanacetum coccineum]